MSNIRTSPAADISREFQSGLAPDVRTRPYIEYSLETIINSDNLSAGYDEVTNIYAPEGFVYKCKGLYLTAPNPLDSTAGKHYFKISSMGACDILYLSSNYSDDLIYNYSQVKMATESYYPEDKAAQASVIEHLVADSNNAIQIKYYNNTNASQGRERVMKLLLEKVKV